MAKPVRLLVGVLLSWIGAVGATSPVTELADPTRPTAPGALLNAPSGDLDAQAKSLELQSTLLRPGRKPMALIDGQWLEQGQVYGGSRVIRVTDTEVILQKHESNEKKSRFVLRLNPEIEKKKPAPVPVKRDVKME